MGVYTHRTPSIFKWIYSDFFWNKPARDKELYLTFDDGPTPVITEYVLDQLAKYEAKATFFCLGSRIKVNQNLFNKIIEQRHSVGNHSHNHLNGWKVSSTEYLADIEKCQQLIQTKLETNPKLFRPPYGKIKRVQVQKLKNEFRIILWDYLTGDFDSSISQEKCLSRAKSRVKNGDIVVFHDNEKAKDKLEYVLPRFLKHFSDLGFKFKGL